MRPACVLDRLNSVRIPIIAVLTFWRAMYEMKYIAQRSQRTLVVAEMPAGRTAVAGACAMVSPRTGRAVCRNSEFEMRECMRIPNSEFQIPTVLRGANL